MTQGIRGRIYRHKKRGSLYRVLEIGNMQCASPEHDEALMIVYEGLDGCVWVRPLAEFQDGRFEQVPIERFAHRDRDASLAENAKRSSGEAVAARAEGIAPDQGQHPLNNNGDSK
jgi:hypothetical protein